MWKLQLCRVLVDLKKFDVFETVGILALVIPQFTDDVAKAQVGY